MIASYVAGRVRRRQPDGAHIVAGSTPVLAFGDPSIVQVATLGINPSSAEFLSRAGTLLSGPAQRLETMASVRGRDPAELDDSQVAQIVEGCAGYFRRNPYRTWFDKLDDVVRPALGRSYYDGSLCHLDLVQWATSPVWGEIPEPATRRTLMDADVAFLGEQLAQENIRVVVVNGRQVVAQLTQALGVPITEVGRTSLGNQSKTASLVRGERDGVHFVGWTLNIQHAQTTARNRREVSAWLAALASELELEEP